jgi:hypothetical protein
MRRDVEETLHLRKGRDSIGGRSRRQQPRLESMGKTNEIFWKTIGPEFGKRAARFNSGLQRIKNWALRKGRPPPKRKKKLQVEREPAMWKHRHPPLVRERKKNNVEGIDGTLSGAPGTSPVRRERW